MKSNELFSAAVDVTVVVSVEVTYVVNDNCSTGLMTLIRNTSVVPRASVSQNSFLSIVSSIFNNDIMLFNISRKMLRKKIAYSIMMEIKLLEAQILVQRRM